ncbi:beta-L-arabinofuranosidase domain-containing protein [Glaciecola sp. 1036]|uniref:beta-L-arabinofuranosidase domain-containing protein n=1 Tax=Alteromonadaceae TaxID=72275 RepID=UPI003CFDDD9B
MKFSILVTALLTIVIGVTGCNTKSSDSTSNNEALVQIDEQQRLFSLHQVSLTEGPFAHAQQTNIEYLLAMSPDRLLAPYLKEAGIEAKAPAYGNWESSGLDGHIGGHYLTALSLAWAASGEQSIKERLDYMVGQLYQAQKANKGYLGGIPNGKEIWAQIREGNISAGSFSLNNRWVPLYNIDKIYHGLYDAHVIGKNDLAKSMLFDLGEWMLEVTQKLSDEQIQQMLHSEHGGLNDVFAKMAALYDDSRFLHLAEKFTHQRILQPLMAQKDELTGLHANTQIPKVVGIMQIAGMNQDEAWVAAAKYFWENVTQKRSVSIGGNSVKEHFHDADNFTAMIDDIEGPETCNTYNMLKLSKALFLHTGDTRYLDYYEKATYNHILSSQHPDHGGLVYFTSMRPGHFRKYSSVHDSMWCCVGSGIENHSKYAELIYTHNDQALWVNLFMGSLLTWEDKNLKLEMQTAFPDKQNVTLTVNAKNDEKLGRFTLNLRVPEWIQGDFAVSINGNRAQGIKKQGYLSLQREWLNGDKITFSLNAQLIVEQLPDGQDYYSITYGPVVLATPIAAFAEETLNLISGDGRMDHVAVGAVCPPEAIPVMLDEPEKFIQSLTRTSSEQLVFQTDSRNAVVAQSFLDNKQPILVPFFRLHDSRYQVYWPQQSPQGYDNFIAQAKQKAAFEQAIESITIDQITPGQQQPEVEHNFAGENTRAGVNEGRHWRAAQGWFSYVLDNQAGDAKSVRITYSRKDVWRHFSILLNDTEIAKVALPVPNEQAEFYSVDYPIPENLQSQKSLVIKFEANPGSTAGGIYGIRLLREYSQ